MPQDARLYAPAAARNRQPILDVLKRHLPSGGLVLEVGSGTGEHVVHFARACPDLVFQPSDPDASHRASIDAWVAALGLSNVRPTIALDAAAQAWPVEAADAILCSNMIHIAPWAAAVGLVRGAGRVLAPGGLLYLYGPYKRGGQHTAPATRPSTPACARRTRSGACAMSKASSRSPSRLGLQSPRSSRCPPTTSRSSSGRRCSLPPACRTARGEPAAA